MNSHGLLRDTPADPLAGTPFADWIDANALGRRNLTRDQWELLLGRRYNRRKKAVGVRGPEKLDQNEPASTAEVLATEYGVSSATVKRAGMSSRTNVCAFTSRLTAADWAKRKGMGGEVIQYARSYALEAERRMGELLMATPRAKGAAAGGKKESPRGHYTLPRGAKIVQLPDVTTQPTLVNLGIMKRESSQAKLLAGLPRKVFDAVRDNLEKTVGYYR